MGQLGVKEASGGCDLPSRHCLPRYAGHSRLPFTSGYVQPLHALRRTILESSFGDCLVPSARTRLGSPVAVLCELVSVRLLYPYLVKRLMLFSGPKALFPCFYHHSALREVKRNFYLYHTSTAFLRSCYAHRYTTTYMSSERTSASTWPAGLKSHF